MTGFKMIEDINLASKIFGSFCCFLYSFLGSGKLVPGHPLNGEMIEGFKYKNGPCWGVPVAGGDAFRISIGIFELTGLAFCLCMFGETKALTILSIIGPLMWAFVTAGGTMTHILSGDPMFARCFCGTICTFSSIYAALRIAAVDNFEGEADGIVLPVGIAFAVVGLTFLGSHFTMGYVVKGQDEKPGEGAPESN